MDFIPRRAPLSGQVCEVTPTIINCVIHGVGTFFLIGD